MGIILNKTEHTVINNRIINDSLFQLIINRNNISFMPGDCVAIYSSDGKSRPYSIASDISDDEIHFIIRAIDHGEVSSNLKSLKKGDKIKISSPFGWFHPKPVQNNYKNIFFATGTGIAPFLSYIKSYPNKPPYMLFYGVRKEIEAIGIDNFKNTKKYLSISREKNNFYTGRITELTNKIPISKDIHYYCCGREKMINEITNYLINNKVLKNQIHCEVFWHG